MPTELPAYAKRMLAFHRAHRAELAHIVAALPLSPGDRVLDVACGDGTYLELFGARGARAHGVDVNREYLTLCAERTGRGARLVRGDARCLPFADGAFAGALCAQSFYSLPDVPRAVAEMRRVVRPGGWVAVMENDRLHHVMLPWPPGLELALRFAEYQALQRQARSGSQHYSGRRLGSVLRDAGLQDECVQAHASHRRAPLDPDEHLFLTGYVDEWLALAREFLTPSERAQAERLADPDSPDCLLNSPRLEVTYLDVLAWARVSR